MSFKKESLKIREVLSSINLKIKDFQLFELIGGKNNKAFKVLNNGKTYFAKLYFLDVHRKYSRLETEMKFFKFLKRKKILNIPNPVIFSVDKNIGLFDFIDGIPYEKKDEVAKINIKEAAEFFRNLNRNFSFKEDLNNASDAFFNIENLFASLDSRLEKLKAMDLKYEVDREAKIFVNEVLKFWKNEKLNISFKLNQNNLRQLNKEDVCISPSDFGFHNALNYKNRTYFYDFEHAGYDDPSKFICDFFLQPKISVSFKFFDYFVKHAFVNFKNKETIVRRSLIMFSIFKVKWICIILNEFLNTNLERRIFSNSIDDIEKTKVSQLKKAKLLFSELM